MPDRPEIPSPVVRPAPPKRVLTTEEQILAELRQTRAGVQFLSWMAAIVGIVILLSVIICGYQVVHALNRASITPTVSSTCSSQGGWDTSC